MRRALLVTLALTGLPATALADPCDDGVRAGVALRREGRDAEAMALFRDLVGRCSQPRVRVQLAWAEQAVGRWVDAEHDLRTALATSADPWVDPRRARLEQDLAHIREHVGLLQVTGGVAGAEVLVDGVAVATLPMTEPVRAAVGAARVELRHEGYYPVRRDVTIAAGVVAREDVQMRLEAPPAPTVTVAAPPLVLDAPAIAAPPPRMAPQPPRIDRTWRSLAWTSTFAASALGAAAIVALGYRQSRFDDFQGDPGCFVDVDTGLPVGGTSCVSAHGAVQSAGVAAVVTSVAAGVFAAGAVVAWVRARGVARAESAAAWSCLPAPAGAVCAGRF